MKQALTKTSESTLLTFQASSDPDPPQASPPSGHERTLALTFVANLREDVEEVLCDRISFHFDIGDEKDASYLTSTGTGIKTSVSPTTDWELVQAEPDGTFIFKRPTGVKPDVVKQGYTFEIFNILVTRVVGTARVTVNERSCPHGQPPYERRTATFEVPKFPARFGAVRFSTNTTAVNYGDTAELTWEGDDDAHYALSWNGGEPVDVSHRSSWSTPPLEEDTVFELRVSYQAEGQRVTRAYYITVQVITPRINSCKASPTRIAKGDPVTVTWKCLHAAEGQLSWEDGKQDLDKKALERGELQLFPQCSTAFHLWVSNGRSDAEGADDDRWSQRVDVVYPAVLPGAELKPWLGEGRVLAGRWVTENAASVSIEVAGQAADERAPADATHQPYPVVIAAPAGTPEVAITAWGKDAHDKHVFGQISVGTPKTVQGLLEAVDVATTTDIYASWRRLALVLHFEGVTIVGLETGEAYEEIGVGGNGPVAVAATGDGKVAFALTNYLGEAGPANLYAIRMDYRTAAAPRQVAPYAHAMRVTPDGSVAVVLSDVVTLVDIPSWHSPVRPLPGIAKPVRCAITPDGKLALVTIPSGHVVVVKLPGGQVEPARITAGTSGGDVAVSADGTFALVADPRAQALTFVDIASRRQTGHAIDLPGTPGTIGISPDGGLAVVALPQTREICVVDVARRQASPITIPVGSTPSAVAITPDGATILVAVADGNRLLML